MALAEIGLVGLGVMGAALALNIAEKGHRIAVWNRSFDVTQKFYAEAGDLAARLTPAEGLKDLVAAIDEPRAIILMVPAGDPVDEMIAKLRPLLGAGDLIIEPVRQRLHKYAWKHCTEPCRIIASALDTTIGDLSAIAVAVCGMQK